VNKKRKQHYIWKHYLRAWATNEKIFCLMAEKVFKTNLDKIGNIRDFYKLEKLTNDDIEIINHFYFKDMHPEYMKLNIAWIPIFNKVFEIKDLFNSLGILNKKVNQEFDILINNLIEEFHAIIESDSVFFLNSLQKNDMSFLNNENSYNKFMYFLSLQYFRTRKRKEAIASTNAASIYPQLIKSWPIVSIILATSMAFTLSLHRDKYRFMFLKTTDSYFITGDQPVINTFANHNEPRILRDDEFELYYPITPKLALLITMSDKYKINETKELSEIEVKYYNNKIFLASYEQIYSDKKEILEEFLDIKKNSLNETSIVKT